MARAKKPIITEVNKTICMMSTELDLDSAIIAGARWVKGDSITEDGKHLGELHISFKNTNTTYVYHEVPASIAFGFLHADSLGAYFSENIKSVYKCDKI